MDEMEEERKTEGFNKVEDEEIGVEARGNLKQVSDRSVEEYRN